MSDGVVVAAVLFNYLIQNSRMGQPDLVQLVGRVVDEGFRNVVDESEAVDRQKGPQVSTEG